jgi:hypothetical protein
MKQHFENNYDKLLEFINKKIETNNHTDKLVVNLYLMTTKINYNDLKIKLQLTKEIVQTQVL